MTRLARLGPVVALLLASAFFALRTERFLSGENLSLVLQQVMVVGVIAIGQTLVILTAGIDLSCGMVMALAGMVMTKLAAEAGVAPAVAILAGVGVALCFGLVNGLLVSRLALPPFIVTLGTLNIAFALTQLFSDAQTVTEVPALMTALGEATTVGGTGVVHGVPVMLLLYLLAWWILRDTAAGRHVYAVGNHPEAARLAGVATGRVLLGVYATAGALYGVAAGVAYLKTGKKPTGYTNTGVTLIAARPVPGVPSSDVKTGMALCFGRRD